MSSKNYQYYPFKTMTSLTKNTIGKREFSILNTEVSLFNGSKFLSKRDALFAFDQILNKHSIQRCLEDKNKLINALNDTILVNVKLTIKYQEKNNNIFIFPELFLSNY